MLHPRITSALNRELQSQLRVEIDEVVLDGESGQVNLTSVARRIQATLDMLESVSADRLNDANVVEVGGLLIRWHARKRRAGEDAEPVIA